MKNDQIKTIVNEQLSSVEFIQDYLQLHFDGRTLTCYIWPEVRIGNDINYKFQTPNYRDALCSLIALKVIDIQIKDQDFLKIQFEKSGCEINLNLDSRNPEVVSEIAVFNDTVDSSWSVYD